VVDKMTQKSINLWIDFDVTKWNKIWRNRRR